MNVPLPPTTLLTFPRPFRRPRDATGIRPIQSAAAFRRKSIAAAKRRQERLRRARRAADITPSRVGGGKMAVFVRLQMLGHYDVLVVVTAFLLCGITQA